jgi:hypothetical protein
MIKKNEKYLKLINTLNEFNKVKNPNKVIVENIRLVYELLADKVIDHKEAVGIIHEIIGYFSKNKPATTQIKQHKKSVKLYAGHRWT